MSPATIIAMAYFGVGFYVQKQLARELKPFGRVIMIIFWPLAILTRPR